MESATNLTVSTVSALTRDKNLYLGLAILILAFAVYVYLFPTPFSEYFVDGAPKKIPANINRG